MTVEPILDFGLSISGFTEADPEPVAGSIARGLTVSGRPYRSSVAGGADKAFLSPDGATDC